MKNRFVKLTLFLCIIMMMAATGSSFAASSGCSASKYNGGNCGTGKYASKNCTVQKCESKSDNTSVKGTSNYMALFGKSNEECMNSLLKAFGLKVKKPAVNTNNNSGAGTGSNTNSANTSNSGNKGNCTNSSNNSGKWNCTNGGNTNKWNCGSNDKWNCTGAGCENTGSNQDCIGGNCGNNDNSNQDCIGGNCGNTGNNTGNNNQNNGGTVIGGKPSTSTGSYAQQVADIVNDERSKAGLSSLTMNSDLSKVAQAKAEDMRDKNYFSHTSPTYGSPFDMMKQFGISYSAAGENIAKGQRSPESVMTAWMNSQGHRANILNSSYDQIGVGYCTDANGNTYWVQMFIK